MRLIDENFDIKSATNEQLAFVGDAVYSLIVRESLCCKGKCRSGELHSLSIEMVKAHAQANAYKAIESFLSEKEIAFYKKGRNAHNNNTPKNATEGDYHSATGIEVLFGYLYLTDQTDRIRELFNIICTKK